MDNKAINLLNKVVDDCLDMNYELRRELERVKQIMKEEENGK